MTPTTDTIQQKKRVADNRGTLLPHLYAWRRYRALTQKDLATRIECNIYSIKNWEAGRTGASLSHVGRLSRVLNIPPDALIHDQPETATPAAVQPTDVLDVLLDYLAERVVERLKKSERERGERP